MALKLMSDLDRFVGKCRYVRLTCCWEWTGRLDRDGYGGQFKVGSHTDGTRRAIRPHRWSYEHFIGPIPEGLVIDHLCRNRACQNPWHMEPVTTVVNTKRGARATATHCCRGHPFEGDNLRLNAAGGRICRACFREYQYRYQKANGRKHQTAYRERLKEKRKSALGTS